MSESMASDPTSVHCSREAAVGLAQQYRAAGKRIGYTSGVFDILHAGHVEYLAYARSRVDVLFVGVNSDASVRANKGPQRPINSEQQRAAVLAGLRAVSHLFIFSERNNNVNIELLRPDLYIKAGDYSAAQLSSKQIVEQYGGQVEFAPFAAGLSTTGVIERIAATLKTAEGEAIAPAPQPAIFVDRDGTVNEHVEYLSEPHLFKEIPGSFAALKRLRESGYRIIVVTNQPGIGLGYFSKEDFFAVNREMFRQASAVGCMIDKVYFCPHSKADRCRCRKPGQCFIERAVEELRVDLSASFAIGDMTSDVELGKRAGCRGVLVKTGRGGDDGICETHPDFEVQSLAEAADLILSLPR